jgi:hypothetical protein
LVFLTVTTIGAPRAFAAPGNTYTVDIDSNPDAPGPAAGTVGNYVGRLDNLGPGSLGSANIGAPQGFTIQSVSAPLLDGVNQQGTATLNASGVIELRSLNAPSGHFVAIPFTALGPCASGGYSWPDPAVKKGPGFTGPSFSKSTTAPSDQSTDISGNCHLAFLTQPAATKLGNVTTSVGFDPSGAPVRVEVRDGANDPLTSFTGTVELAVDSTTLPPGTPAPDISGNSTSASSPSPGVYSFPGLTLGPDTQYTLQARSPAIPSAGWPVSDPFRVWENACEQGNRCDAGDRRSVTASVKSSGESGTALAATTGAVEASQATSLVLVSVGADPLPDCGDSFNHPPAAITVDTTGSIAGTKTLTVTIDRSVVNALSNNGAKFYEACFARPQTEGTFTTTDGTNAPLVGDEFIGLLPGCPSNPTDPDAPCVLSKSKTMGGDVTLVILLDAADPRCC